MEDIEIKQTRGPTLRFKGTLLAEEEWEGRNGPMRLELWQTEGGALIPVSEGPMPHGRPGDRDVRADVVDPIPVSASKGMGSILGETLVGEDPGIDHEAMRFAVMDFFDWENRARSMVRKQLRWSLVRDIA